MATINKYYQILGVPETATLEEVKKAYRNKARLLHPDKNKAANAKDQFILLHEAYEYITDVKTGKIHQVIPDIGEQLNNVHEIWEKIKAQAVREEARKKAEKKYLRFLKEAEEFKQYYILNLALNIFFVALSIGFIIILPILGFVYNGFDGLIINMVLSVLLFPLYIKTWEDLSNFLEMKNKVEQLEDEAKKDNIK